MGIWVRPREHLERTSEGLHRPLCCCCRLLSCAGGLPSVAVEGLCLDRPLLPTAPAPAASPPAKEKGSPSNDPYGPTNDGEEGPGGRREEGGRRREVGRGGTGVRQIPTSFLRPICAPASGPPGVSRALPCLFPTRTRFPPSSRSRAGRFPAREQCVFHRLDAFFDRLRAINLCHAIKRAPNHAQRLIQRLPPKRNAGPTFSV